MQHLSSSLLQDGTLNSTNITADAVIDIHSVITYGITECYFTGINLLCFLCFLFLQNVQPLKSRHRVPLFVNFFFGVINIPVTVWHILTLLNIIPDYYNIAVYLKDVVYVCVVVVVCQQILRLVIFQNLGIIQRKYTKARKQSQKNQRQSEQLQQEAEFIAVRRRVRVYKFLLSPLFTFLTLLPVFLFLLAIAITWILLTYIGGMRTSTYRYIVTIACTFVPLGICAVLLIYDLVLNKFKIFNICKFFVTKDRLLFRIDYLVGIVAFICTVFSLGLPLVVSMNGTRRYIIFVFDLIRFTGITLATGGGNCILHTLITRITSALRSKRSMFDSSKNLKSSSKPGDKVSFEMNEEMRLCLQSEDGLKAFGSFVKGEFSQENLECWIAIQEFKSLSSKEARSSLLKKMLYTFILPNSVMEVNIPQSLRMEVLGMYKEVLFTGIPTPKLLDMATKSTGFRGSKMSPFIPGSRKGSISGSSASPSLKPIPHSPKPLARGDSADLVIEIQPTTTSEATDAAVQSTTSPSEQVPTLTQQQQQLQNEIEERLLSNDLLQNLEVQIILNLQDSFSRFKRTWNYSHLIQAITLLRKHSGM